jgi:hypothetical protein
MSASPPTFSRVARLASVLALAASFATPANAGAPAPFSAVLVTTSRSNPPETMTMKVFSSGTRFRIESGTMVVVSDPRSGKSYNLIASRKLAIEMPGDADGQQGLSPDANPCAAKKGSTCKDLGTEKIGGRLARKWLVTPEKGEVTTVWLDPRIGFPLKTDSPHGSSELHDIKEGPQPEVLFAVPPDYKITSTSGLRDLLGSHRGEAGK